MAKMGQEVCSPCPFDDLLPSRRNRLDEYGLYILHPATVDEFLDDVLVIVLLESVFGLVPLEEVKDARIILVTGQAVVHNAFFELGQPGGFFVDGFDLVGMFGVGVDLRDMSAFRGILIPRWQMVQFRRHKTPPPGCSRSCCPSGLFRPLWETRACRLRIEVSTFESTELQTKQ